jgi:hypothetical protein
MQGSLVGILLLGLFAVSIVVIYLAIRLDWLPLAVVSVVGTVVNTILLVLYSLSQHNGFGQAITVGLVVGLLFTVITVSVAVYFQTAMAHATGENQDLLKK